MISIRNLFSPRLTKEAQRWYAIYLSCLSQQRKDRRVVEACRLIRLHARRVNHPEWAYFTYSHEIEALCRVGNYSGAWRQLRRWERSTTGKNLELKTNTWTPDEINWFLHYHPQILYLLGRYQPACRMIEVLLNVLLRSRRKGVSYEILWRVYGPVKRPRIPHEVSLYHIYRKLGKSLLQWRCWKHFIDGFNPRIFALAKTPRERLMDDPSLLKKVCQAIASERAKRLTANVSVGEHELLEGSNKIMRFQRNVAAKQKALDQASVQQQHKLKEIFPDI